MTSGFHRLRMSFVRGASRTGRGHPGKECTVGRGDLSIGLVLLHVSLLSPLILGCDFLDRGRNLRMEKWYIVDDTTNKDKTLSFPFFLPKFRIAITPAHLYAK